MSKHKVPGMPGWTDLGSDCSWDDYSGKWGRKAADGAWYVVTFTNMIDACGEREAAEIGYVYEASVKRLHIGDLTAQNVRDGLSCCGYSRTPNGVYLGSGDELTDPAQVEIGILDACLAYGFGAPLESFTGKVHASRIRANARRFAEECMHDAELLEKQLDRPVNKIGSTAREYGLGDINSALFEYRGQDPVMMGIMRKMHGIP